MHRFTVVAVAVLLLLLAHHVSAGPLPGAIFTTLEEGTRVNANIYPAKGDVYLDGGPGPNAPIGAAGLPAGDYYFQVTDPSGKVLLSLDPVKCRRFHVNAQGVIDGVVAATVLDKVKGQLVEVSCTHLTGVDADHNAVTVQLMPYDDTPNKGGVYKVWATPVGQFVGDPEFVDNPAYFHGFVPAWSKTDNYKVRRGKPTAPPTIYVQKFHDWNMNGVWDPGEPEIPGWEIEAIDPETLTTSTYYTPATITAGNAGVWMITEIPPQGENWLQTALWVDGVAVPIDATAYVEVFGQPDETHGVLFGNVQLGEIKGYKFYDRNGNGQWDTGEPGVPGFVICLSGTTVAGTPVEICKETDQDGEASFIVPPGTYTLTEQMPTGNWQATTPTTGAVSLPPGGFATVSFGNICTGAADFDTKGYWHNKNGLTELTAADIAYVNGLLPYSSASSYFDDGDEPFDGLFGDGTLVAAVNGDWGDVIAGEGTAKAEVSRFLVDANAGGDPREQLAQQLLAFIFNVRHRLDDPGAGIQLPDGTWVTGADLIAQAIAIWASGTLAEQTEMASLLDNLNNSDALPVIHFNPCPVIY
jgi:hypothetical protein